MGGVVYVKLVHSYLSHRDNIFLTHLLINIKSQVSTFPMWLTFSVVVPLYAVGFIYILGQLGFVSFILLCVNNRVYYGPIVISICLYFTLPHHHHCADVSESIELRKCLRCILLSVCLRLIQSFQLLFMQYMGLCVSSLLISPVMIEKIRLFYLIIIIKSEIWTICHWLGLGHETMV